MVTYGYVTIRFVYGTIPFGYGTIRYGYGNKFVKRAVFRKYFFVKSFTKGFIEEKQY